MTQEEKDRIDYEIEAKWKAREKNLYRWLNAFCFTVILLFVAKSCLGF